MVDKKQIFYDLTCDILASRFMDIPQDKVKTYVLSLIRAQEENRKLKTRYVCQALRNAVTGYTGNYVPPISWIVENALQNSTAEHYGISDDKIKELRAELDTEEKQYSLPYQPAQKQIKG